MDFRQRSTTSAVNTEILNSPKLFHFIALDSQFNWAHFHVKMNKKSEKKKKSKSSMQVFRLGKCVQCTLDRLPSGELFDWTARIGRARAMEALRCINRILRPSIDEVSSMMHSAGCKCCNPSTWSSSTVMIVPRPLADWWQLSMDPVFINRATISY